jgi:hypothetical protein
MMNQPHPWSHSHVNQTMKMSRSDPSLPRVAVAVAIPRCSGSACAHDCIPNGMNHVAVYSEHTIEHSKLPCCHVAVAAAAAILRVCCVCCCCCLHTHTPGSIDALPQSTVNARALCVSCSIANSSSEQLATTASAWPWHGRGEQWHTSGLPRSSRRAASTHRCPSVSPMSHCQYASTAVWCAAVVCAAGREIRLPHRPSPRRPTYTMSSVHGPPSSRLLTKCLHLDVKSARVHRRVS